MCRVLNVLWVFLLFLTACGGSKTEVAKTEAGADATTPVDPASAANITGRVQYSGAKPERKAISMDAVPKCAEQHKGEILAEDILVNADGMLKNVFVYVKSGLPNRQWPVPQTPVRLDQQACVYQPRVFGVMVGQDLAISNRDPSMHNVHPLPRNNREWNASQAPKGEIMLRQFEKEEVMIPFKCNVHPWMRAFAGVLPHPFFAVSETDGSFRLAGLPPGRYTIAAWHERLGTQEIAVEAGKGETKQIRFSFKN
jgi:plastocyanin